jgi:hypothetical protein
MIVGEFAVMRVRIDEDGMLIYEELARYLTRKQAKEFAQFVGQYDFDQKYSFVVVEIKDVVFEAYKTPES